MPILASPEQLWATFIVKTYQTLNQTVLSSFKRIYDKNGRTK
jgi:hypothetical protein